MQQHSEDVRPAQKLSLRGIHRPQSHSPYYIIDVSQHWNRDTIMKTSRGKILMTTTQSSAKAAAFSSLAPKFYLHLQTTSTARVSQILRMEIWAGTCTSVRR
jgi:hypothetical protein